MRRLIPVLLAGMVLFGAAACGDKSTPTATPPSPTPAAKPDAEACSKANGVALLAAMRIGGVVVSLELAQGEHIAEQDAIETAMENMDEAAGMADETLAAITHAELKAVVQEYKDFITTVKQALSGADMRKAIADLESAAAKLEQTAEKLDQLCADTEPAPEPSGSAKAGCAEFEKIYQELFESLFSTMLELSEVSASGGNTAALTAKLLDAFDKNLRDMTALAAGPVDPQLKTALQEQITVMQSIRAQFAVAAKDPKKLEDFIDNGPPGGEDPSTGKAIELCGVK